jgi:hypothetical protein
MIGRCPYCEEGVVEMEKKQVHGAVTKVYACSNVRIVTEDGECFEHAGSCTYRIWGNALRRYGKRALGPKEVRRLLADGQCVVTLRDSRGNDYRKYIIPHPEYGIEVLFSEEVEE